MKKFTKTIYLLAFAAIGFTSCTTEEMDSIEKNTGIPIITTVSIKFTNVTDTNDYKIFTYRDLDNIGPKAPTFDKIVLSPLKKYSMKVVSVKDETKESPVEYVSKIKDDDTNFLFGFKPFQANVGVTIKDMDRDNHPVGLLSEVNTGESSTGNMSVILIYDPSAKVSVNPGGIQFFDYTYPIEIK